MEKMEKNEKQKYLKWIAAAIVVAIPISGLVMYTSFASSSATSASNSLNTITLSKTEIANTISVSGQVDSSSVINIYSSLSNYPVKEVLVKIGDNVQKGDVLARIDTTNLEYDIEQSKNNLENAQKTLGTEKQNNQNGIVTAQNSLNSAIVSRDRQQLAYEKSLADRKEAETTIAKSFDSYTYDNAITEAKVALDKKKADLAEAEHRLNSEKKSFDAYTYENAINDAKIILDRAKSDLEKAISDQNSLNSSFDSSSYDWAVDAAQAEVERCQTDYNTILLANNNDTTVPAVADAQSALENAQAALSNAQNDRAQAQSDFIASYQSEQDAAGAKVTAAKNAVEDAQRAYDQAVENLNRAHNKAVEDASNNVNTAKTAVSDAQRAYDQSVGALARARDTATEDNAKQLATAKRNVSDAEKALESTKLSVTNAQNSLNQAKSKFSTGESNVANQQIVLDKLLDQLANAEITASESGTITAVNAIKDTNPNGVLFTIENTNLLYVSANVKEYNLKDFSIGQSVLITTDATDKEIFEGDIIYISPKAVSQAGSTSVEFEIWVAIKNPNKNIKIGMNAFLEIVVSSKEDVYVVPLSAIITNETGTFVRSQTDDQTTDIPVVIGIKTNTSAEISGKGIIDGLVVFSDPNAVPTPKQSLLKL